MGLFSRMKGKRGERQIAELLRPVFGADVRRGWQSRSGKDACDIEGTPYFIEVKVGKCPNPRAALKQAIEATDGRTPLVIVKDDRCEPFVVMRLSDWLEDLWRPTAQEARGPLPDMDDAGMPPDMGED